MVLSNFLCAIRLFWIALSLLIVSQLEMPQALTWAYTNCGKALHPPHTSPDQQNVVAELALGVLIKIARRQGELGGSVN